MGHARHGAGRTLAVPHGSPQRDRQSPLTSGIVPPGWHAEIKRWALCAFYVVSYFGVGILFYSHVERKPCEDDADPMCTEPWSPVDSVYFVMVSMSTVGYGDLAPSTPVSRVFTLFFIIYGIVVPFASLASQLATVMDHASKYFQKVMAHCFGHRDLREWLRCSDEMDEAMANAPGAIIFWVSNMFVPVMMFTTWQLFCACIFMVLQDLTFPLSFYHCVVTATTVGYGDVPVMEESRPFAVIHIGVGVALLGACIAEVPALFDIRSVQIRQLEILQRALDVEMIKQLDRDGNGVDKLEFCIGILIEIGAELGGLPLQWEDIVPFIKQFEAFDVDKSGHLSTEDLELMASTMEANRTELRHQFTRQMSMRIHREALSAEGSMGMVESPQSPQASVATNASWAEMREKVARQVSDASNASWAEMRQKAARQVKSPALLAATDPEAAANASVDLRQAVESRGSSLCSPSRTPGAIARQVSL